MSDQTKERVTLIEITSTEHPVSKEKCWRVVLEYRVRKNEPMLQFTIFPLQKEFSEEHLVALARCALHNICQGIAGGTEEWGLSQQQIDGLKIPQSPPSPQSAKS